MSSFTHDQDLANTLEYDKIMSLGIGITDIQKRTSIVDANVVENRPWLQISNIIIFRPILY